MRKSLLLFLSVFFSGTALFSQSDFRQGYVINNENDTISGLIDYKGNKASAEICLFKYNSGSDEIRFTPEDIKSYRFTDSKYYVSKKLNADGEEAPLFLEFLVDGIVDVYYFRDNTGENYLIDKGDGKLILLDDKEKEVVVNDTRYLRANKPYVGILKYVFMNSPTVSKEVERISLDHKSLIKVAKDYHAEVCTDRACIIYEKKLPVVRISAGFLLGFNVNSIIYREDLTQPLIMFKTTGFNKSVFPSAGIFAKVGIPTLNERIYLQYTGSLGKRSFSMTSDYKGKQDTTAQVHETFNFSQFAFDNTLMFRYEFPGKRIFPVFQAGFFMDCYFSNVFDYHVFVNDVEYLFENSKSYPFNNVDFGFAIGAGVTGKIRNRRNVHFNIDYQIGQGIAPNMPSRNVVARLGVQIGR